MRTFLRTGLSGIPHFENIDAFRGPPILSRDQLSWNHVDFIRPRWKGNFVLEGVMNVEDAKRARDESTALTAFVTPSWLLAREIDRDLAMLGVRNLSEIGQCAIGAKLT
jgi:hypothetical protein